MRLQCYEGLDEAKALYEWNYRKQLLRIQTEASGTGWDAVQDDIFSAEFLLERPLMTAISSEEPVVLLIDEIDKTDQEFEAMLLELLSDFQISIPELGRIDATTRPVVVLTSNNSRELTEALKRRCLYLWLDYPELELELEIVKLHTPELSDVIGRKLVEVIHQVRELDLKKPPSIAESIDWARALLLLGAEDIDADTFRETMSVIVKHRTDLDTVAERIGVKLAGWAWPMPPAADFSAQILSFAEELRAEGLAIGTAELLDAFEALGEVSWTQREDVKETLAATLAKSQEDRRVFDLIFERFFFRAAEAEAIEQDVREEGGIDASGAQLIDLDALRAQIAAALAEGNDGAMRDLARLAIAAFGRQGEGSGVIGVDVQRIRRALGLRAEPQPELPPEDPRAEGLPARRDPRVRGPPAPRAGAGHDRAHSQAAALAAAERARPRAPQRPAPGPGRRCTASSPSSSGAWPPRATSTGAGASTRRWTCAARCAPRCRPAACRSSSRHARGVRGAPRSTCCATSRRR